MLMIWPYYHSQVKDYNILLTTYMNIVKSVFGNKYKKTKVIVFNSSGRALKPFQFVYDGKLIAMVKEFKYLGTTLSPSGSLFLAKEKLRKKANKAYFPVINALQKIYFDVVTSLKLSDSLIKPILTYNCEFWGSNKIQNVFFRGILF